jgi:hypothetical protein
MPNNATSAKKKKAITHADVRMYRLGTGRLLCDQVLRREDGPPLP